MRLLTWNLWGNGPLFEDRLKAAVSVISEIRPTIFSAQCLPPGGSGLLKSVPSWRRLGMREIESPYLSNGSFSALYASSDAVVCAINPADDGEIQTACLLLQVEVSGTPSISLAVRILTHTRESPGCLQSTGAIDDLGGMNALLGIKHRSRNSNRIHTVANARRVL